MVRTVPVLAVIPRIGDRVIVSSKRAGNQQDLFDSATVRVGDMMVVVQVDPSDGTTCTRRNGVDKWLPTCCLAPAVAVGDTVQRGPSWCWGDQDGGAGNRGRTACG